jgi:hypothetical protein
MYVGHGIRHSQIRLIQIENLHFFGLGAEKILFAFRAVRGEKKRKKIFPAFV